MIYLEKLKNIFNDKKSISLQEKDELLPVFTALKSLPLAYRLAIDIGANTGSVTKDLWEMGFSIYGVEPHPELANLLRQEFSQKKYKDKIKILEFAASDSNGTAELWVGLLNTLSTLESYWTVQAFPEYFREKQAIQVRTKKISDMVAEFSIKKIGFLKVDTEGHDANVLKGTFAEAFVFPLIVMFEGNQRFPQKVLECLSVLYENNYKVFDFHLKAGEKILGSYRLETPQLPSAWSDYPSTYFYANIVAYHSDLLSVCSLSKIPFPKGLVYRAGLNKISQNETSPRQP